MLAGMEELLLLPGEVVKDMGKQNTFLFINRGMTYVMLNKVQNKSVRKCAGIVPKKDMQKYCLLT